jgi:hypothetical protein
MKAITAGVGLLIVSVVLAYGYWFGVTHGSLYITVMDVSDREHSRDARPVQLVFRDSTGKVLAEAAAAETGDPVSVTSPAIYSCREIENAAFRRLKPERIGPRVLSGSRDGCLPGFATRRSQKSGRTPAQFSRCPCPCLNIRIRGGSGGCRCGTSGANLTRALASSSYSTGLHANERLIGSVRGLRLTARQALRG